METDITRRDLLKTFAATGAGLALAGCAGVDGKHAGPAAAAAKEDRKKVMAAVSARAQNTPVVWLQGQSCSGCSVSVLNAAHPGIAEVLTDVINLEFHQTVMAGTGDVAMKMCAKALEQQKGEFVLVVEGSIPVGADGGYCRLGEENGKPVTFLEWTKRLGAAAKAVLSVGTCATFGGIPAGKPNPTEAKPFSAIMPDATLINIPGCPAHPDWIVGAVAHVLLFGIPELDDNKRPKMFFEKTLHERCERRGYFDDGKMAKDYSDEGCLYDLGCKGPETHCDASIRSWNSKTNWCVQSGGPCIGCTEPSFPDHGNSGLYGSLGPARREELIRQSKERANV